ncbi:Do family serine endopeptidase [Thermodesulfovibrionales bacterium]|nr:Do family serine endopeptidase [Thermodesulfovibrionales bacterium]
MGKIGNTRKIKLLLIANCLLLVFLLLPSTINTSPSKAWFSASGPVERNAAQVLTKFGDAMAEIAKEVKPTVVNISTTKIVRTPLHPFFDDPFFRRFFGDRFDMPLKRKVTSLGSGVIVTSGGYILTNHHVIEGAEDILVTLFDGREFEGKVVGSDPKTDIAVITIDETGLPTIPWGNSDRVRVGEVVLAVGNPFGLGHTVTMGIVSALGRAGMGIAEFEDFIQTDVAINPGNSGGAMVNTRGELIGINTAILTKTGGHHGIGFAIPADMAKSIKDSIIEEGRVVRGWLGVYMQEITAELAEKFYLIDDEGALITSVVRRSPACKGGLRSGDVIVEFDNINIRNRLELRNAVVATSPGTEVDIKVIRDGRPVVLKVTIGELDAMPQIKYVQVENALTGVSVQELSNELRQKFGIDRGIKGVIVNNVERDSPAHNILRRGDIIMEVDRKDITNVEEYNSVISKIGRDQAVLLLIMRAGSPRYIIVRP